MARKGRGANVRRGARLQGQRRWRGPERTDQVSQHRRLFKGIAPIRELKGIAVSGEAWTAVRGGFSRKARRRERARATGIRGRSGAQKRRQRPTDLRRGAAL